MFSARYKLGFCIPEDDILHDSVVWETYDISCLRPLGLIISNFTP
jgi:hypothetical protein